MNVALEKQIRAQDWHYPMAGRDWRDGLLLGNGNLSAVAYAPSHLEWVLNKVDVFDPTVDKALLEKRLTHSEFRRRIDGMFPKNTLFLNDLEDAACSGSRIRDTLSAAVIRLRFWHGIGWSAPSVPLTSQHLSLFDGLLEQQMNAHLFHPRMRMFVPRDTGLFCLRIREESCAVRAHFFELIRPANDLLPVPIWTDTFSVLAFHQELPGGKASYAVALRVVPCNGGRQGQPGQRYSAASEWIQHGDVDLFVSVKSSFECTDPLVAVLRETGQAAEKTFEVLEREHLEWWHHYWDNAYADFGHHIQIQKYFTFSLYGLASSFGKVPMPGLNGLAFGPLNEQTPGVSYQGYAHDQNAQIPAMPFFPLNRVRLIEVLIDTYWNVRGTLRRETRRLFGCQGIFLPLGMNQLGLEYPTRSYRYTLCGSAYTGMILSMAWRYSRDRTLLKEKIYPLLREFVLFYQALLKRGSDGLYHLDWSVPPEIFTLTRDESSTMAMLKVCLETLLEGARLLRRDKRLQLLWEEILTNYPVVCKTPEGAFWCGPDIPLNHYFFGGHLLYPFFPAAIDEDLQSARKTLELIESEAVERSFADRAGQWHPNHEWSMFLITCTRLRCGDRQGGWRGVERFLELFGKENGLFSHDPILIADPAESEENARQNAEKMCTKRCFCDGQRLRMDNPEVPHPICVTNHPDAKRLAPAVLEGNSAFLFMASEVLLQSHGGIINLFPGVPGDFTGSFNRFLAQGGFEVSAAMTKGKLCWFRIHALQGGTIRVRRPDEQELKSHILKKNEAFEYCCDA